MANKPFRFQSPFPCRRTGLTIICSPKSMSLYQHLKVRRFSKYPKRINIDGPNRLPRCGVSASSRTPGTGSPILHDPNASENDKFVALTFLRMPKYRPKVYSLSARIPVRPSSWAKKDNRCGQKGTMRRLFRKGLQHVCQ